MDRILKEKKKHAKIAIMNRADSEKHACSQIMETNTFYNKLTHTTSNKIKKRYAVLCKTLGAVLACASL